jgi:hypothetical protein
MRWFGVLCLLLGAVLTAPAGLRAEPEEVCVPRTAEDLKAWREDLRLFDAKALADARAAEAGRIGDSTDVLRVEDKLFLALAGGGLVRLTDCRYGDGIQLHLYQGYDARGGFYVVAKHEYEDFSYTLITKADGKTSSTLSRPLWSPDSKRFAHGRCDMLNGYDTLQIVRPIPGDLEDEAAIEMPCDMRSCGFSWESATSLSVVCRSASQPAVGDVSFRFMLEGDAWKKVEP